MTFMTQDTFVPLKKKKEIIYTFFWYEDYILTSYIKPFI